MIVMVRHACACTVMLTCPLPVLLVQAEKQELEAVSTRVAAESAALEETLRGTYLSLLNAKKR